MVKNTPLSPFAINDSLPFDKETENMHPAAFTGQKGNRLTKPEGKTYHYVVFSIENQRYALPLECVLRALRMVAIAPVPEMPDCILGVINMAGRIIPVINLRYFLNKTNRESELNDRILILRIKEQMLAVVVDEILGIPEFASEFVEPPNPAFSNSSVVSAIIRDNDSFLMVIDAYYILSEVSKEGFGGKKP